MNNVAVHHNSSYRDASPSKLPRYPASGMNRKSTNKAPSRLEMLQTQYQERILKEKEEKMIQMYENQQQRALGKVNQGQTNGYHQTQTNGYHQMQTNGYFQHRSNGPNQQNTGSQIPTGVSARDFFQKRRMLEKKGYESPPIEQHYQQMRRGYSSGGYSSASSHASSNSRYSKNSAGRDRANPLQPINTTPPVPTKARIARQRQNNGVAQTRSNNRIPVPNPGQNDVVQNDASRASSTSDSSPPPNLQTLRNFQRRRMGVPPRKEEVPTEGDQKLTDFQRWQMDQNRAREQRLERHRSAGAGECQPGDGEWLAPAGKEEEQVEEEDGGAGESMDMHEELERKKRELTEQIRRQQEELTQIQQQKHREEEEIKKANEIERKRAAQQDKKRRQQQAEEEKRRKKEEEDRRKHEEQDRRREDQERRNYEQERKKEEDKERKRQINEDRKQRMQQKQQQRLTVQQERPPSPPEEDDYVLPDAKVDFYTQAALDSDAHGGNVRLAECRICGRKFAVDRLDKHQVACKLINKKRKVFDPTKMRTSGTEMAKYVGKSKAPRKEVKKKNNWRTQHENFLEAIRYAKTVTEMEAAGVDPQNLPPPPKTINPDYVKCPKCNRNFNPATAEKHLPNCRARPLR